MNLDKAVEAVNRGKAASHAIAILGEHFIGRQAQLDLLLFDAVSAGNEAQIISLARQKFEVASLAKSLTSVMSQAHSANRALTPRMELPE